MKKSPLIFDVDGTLWNACAACARGWNRALEELDHPGGITTQDIEGIAGRPFEECVKELLPRLSEERKDIIELLNKGELIELQSNGGEFYPGAIEGVKQLSRERDIFLVSNCQDWYMELFLDHSGLRDFLVDYDSHGASGLPKGEMLSRMKAKHNHQEVTYIGDTLGDQRAAKEAAMKFIWAEYGFGKNLQVPLRIKNFSELIALNY